MLNHRSFHLLPQMVFLFQIMKKVPQLDNNLFHIPHHSTQKRLCTLKKIRLCRSLFSICQHTAFRQILPMTALKSLEMRKYSCMIFPCPQQNHAQKSECRQILNRLKATPHKARLTTLYVINLYLFRHLAQKFFAIRQYACKISVQSDEKSNCVSAAQSLCGVAIIFITEVYHVR